MSSRFRRWRLDGTLRRAHDVLRTLVRLRAGRAAGPTAAVIDSQSAKATGVGGPARGYGGGKRVRGRERHVLVDVMGLLLAVCVHAADVQDREGARLLVECVAPHTSPPAAARLGRSGLWRESCSAGQPPHTGASAEWLRERRGWGLEVVRDGRGAFARRTVLEGLGAHDAVVADVDGDGDPDVVSKEFAPARWNRLGGGQHADFLENRSVPRR